MSIGVRTRLNKPSMLAASVEQSQMVEAPPSCDQMRVKSYQAEVGGSKHDIESYGMYFTRMLPQAYFENMSRST
eukprot:746704-Hanusia_phi.AAC.4